MNIPLPLIELAAFFGVVLYLFTMPSSPLRRDASSDKKADSDSSDAAAAADRSDPGDQRQD